MLKEPQSTIRTTTLWLNASAVWMAYSRMKTARGGVWGAYHMLLCPSTRREPTTTRQL